MNIGMSSPLVPGRILKVKDFIETTGAMVMALIIEARKQFREN